MPANALDALANLAAAFDHHHRNNPFGPVYLKDDPPASQPRFPQLTSASQRLRDSRIEWILRQLLQSPQYTLLCRSVHPVHIALRTPRQFYLSSSQTARPPVLVQRDGAVVADNIQTLGDPGERSRTRDFSRPADLRHCRIGFRLFSVTAGQGK